MGTPQMRWREMHQSGRVAIMFAMRSSPQAGSHLTLFLISSRARWRNVVGEPSGFCHRCVDGDEPLLGGAEDHRVVAAPAVGIAVVNVGPAEERAARGDQVDDRLIGLENSLAVVLREAIVQASVVIDVTGLVESIPRAGVKVVSAVGRGGVDGASSLVGRDVLGENAEDGAIQKRMLKRDPLHARAFEGRDGNGGFQIAGFANRGGERLGHDIDLTLLLERYVVEIRMKSDGE